MSLEKIVEKRTDNSRYLIHWTSPENFWTIIRSGFFIATDASRIPYEQNCAFPTIREGRAVCFSETPIGNYLQSVIANFRYSNKRWGIALPKTILYAYGGRPVLYGDKDFYDKLDKEYQYLFCHFNYYSERGWIDWTHEREWRVRPNFKFNTQIGLKSEDLVWYPIVKGENLDRVQEVKGDQLVPIHLPQPDNHGNLGTQPSENPHFVILIERENHREEFNEFIDRITYSKTPIEQAATQIGYAQIDGYRTKYLVALKKATVISLDQIREERDYRGIMRLEDLLGFSETIQDEEVTAILWNKAKTQIRRQVLDSVAALKHKVFEYCQWRDIDPHVRQRINESRQAIEILKSSL